MDIKQTNTPFNHNVKTREKIKRTRNLTLEVKINSYNPHLMKLTYSSILVHTVERRLIKLIMLFSTCNNFVSNVVVAFMLFISFFK